MLDDVYEEGFGLDLVNKYIAHMTAQIAHRYPRMNILEIGMNIPCIHTMFNQANMTQVLELVV